MADRHAHELDETSIIDPSDRLLVARGPKIMQLDPLSVAALARDFIPTPLAPSHAPTILIGALAGCAASVVCDLLFLLLR